MTEYPKQVKDALERDLGITIGNGRRGESQDERFCYGATCTWFGSIHEVSTTKEHPRHRGKDRDEHGLPCCPICGGMLFEMPDSSEWWDGADKFERGEYPVPTAHAHPGYRAMLEWQKRENKCFNRGSGGLDGLVEAYKNATGITVDVER